jgi:uncharacterized protein YdaT
MEVLQDKSDEVISKVLPYLFMIQKGSENVFLQKDVEYSDDELKELLDNFKEAMQKFNSQKGKIPATAVPFDQKYSHLIPDLRNILSEELFRQGYRAILAGLGFVSIVQGIGDTRKEEIINPRPFITEVNAGLDGFKSLLMDVIRIIIRENKLDHRKLFSDKNNLKIVNSPLKINVQAILDQLRSSYVYGAISIKTYQEALGVDPDQELERMKKEHDEGLRELFYPHLIQNREDIPDGGVAPITKKQTEKEKEKEKKPEDMEESELSLEIAPYTMKNYPKYLDKYPKGAREAWIKTFNEVLKRTNDESKAFPIAWNSLKRWLKKYKYTKKEGIWKSEDEIKSEKLKAKKEKLLDKLLKEDKDENIQG